MNLKTISPVLYGCQYTAGEINLALNSDNPASIVPTRDENGHGTFLASIAAGNRDEREGFSGAAPQASIAMVELNQQSSISGIFT